MQPTKLAIGQRFIYRPTCVIGTVTAVAGDIPEVEFSYINSKAEKVDYQHALLTDCDALCYCGKNPATHIEQDYVSDGYSTQKEYVYFCDACCKCDHIPKKDVNDGLKWCPIIQDTCKGDKCQAFAWHKRSIFKGPLRYHLTPTCFYLEGRIREISQ